MSRFVLSAAIGAGLLVPMLRADDKTDTRVREAAEAFLKALQAEDVDAIMKTVDVPWFHDSKKLIKDKAELKQEFVKVFDEQDLKEITYEVKESHQWAKVRDRLDGEKLEWADEAAGKEARVLVVEVNHQGAQHTLHLLLRIKDGKAIVAGFGR